jgi:hypothetical protein
VVWRSNEAPPSWSSEVPTLWSRSEALVWRSVVLMSWRNREAPAWRRMWRTRRRAHARGRTRRMPCSGGGCGGGVSIGRCVSMTWLGFGGSGALKKKNSSDGY